MRCPFLPSAKSDCPAAKRHVHDFVPPSSAPRSTASGASSRALRSVRVDFIDSLFVSYASSVPIIGSHHCEIFQSLEFSGAQFSKDWNSRHVPPAVQRDRGREQQGGGGKADVPNLIALGSATRAPRRCRKGRSASAPHGSRCPCSGAMHPHNAGRRTRPDSCAQC